MPTFVSTALTSDGDPKTCLENVQVAEKLIPGIRVTKTRMRTANTHVEVSDIEAQTAPFTGNHKVTTGTHYRNGHEVVVDFGPYRNLGHLDATQAYFGSFALEEREGIGTVVSLAVHAVGIDGGDPCVPGMANDAVRNLASVPKATPQKHNWV